MVLAAHESLLSTPKMGPFLINAVRWLAKGQAGRVGVDTSLEKLCFLLSNYGLQCSVEHQMNSDLQVYCCTAYSDRDAGSLREFVAEGGGLLIGGQSWWWASQHSGRSAMAGFPGNHILNGLGLSIGAQTIKPGCFPVPTPEMLSYHFRKALAAFHEQLKQGSGCLEQTWLAAMGSDGAAFLQIPTHGIPTYVSVHRLLRKMLYLAGLPAVSKEKPVARGSLKAAILSLATQLAHSGTDCSQLVQGLGSCTFDASLYPVEQPVTMEVEAYNPGLE